MVSITLQKENQDYFAAEREMRKYRRHAIILASVAVVFVAIMIISMIIGGDIAFMASFVSGMCAAVFAMMAGISFVSGVRDQQKKMRLILAGTSRVSSHDTDAISRTELRADILLYASLVVVILASLCVIVHGVALDLSTSNLSHAAGISAYVLIIAGTLVAGVGGSLSFVKYVRENLGLPRTQSE